MIIKNGLVALPGEKDFLRCNIRIKDGRITSLGGNSYRDEDVINAEGLCIFPGAIDAHVHFNTPGFEEREDFYHGSCFAASGGITTVIDMPCTSRPAVTSLENLKIKLETVKKQSVTDYAFYGGVSSNSFRSYEKNMEELAPLVMGYKVYTVSGMDTFGALSYEELRKVIEKAWELHRPVLVHAEDREFICDAERRERRTGNLPENYYLSRPEAAELAAIKQITEIVKNGEGDLHIVHVSTGKSVDLAAESGITFETCPHYLSFSFTDFVKLGSILKVAPVLKQFPAREELWHRLSNGRISFVTSDHAACRKQDKETGSIWTDYAGISGTGTMFPYLYSEGFVDGRLSLQRFLEITASAAAERYGIEKRKGSIEPGKDADLILLDPRRRHKIKGADFLSKGRFSPWEGISFRGRIIKTIRRGEIIYDEWKGITAQSGSGEFLREE